MRNGGGGQGWKEEQVQDKQEGREAEVKTNEQ